MFIYYKNVHVAFKMAKKSSVYIPTPIDGVGVLHVLTSINIILHFMLDGHLGGGQILQCGR